MDASRSSEVNEKLRSDSEVKEERFQNVAIAVTSVSSFFSILLSYLSLVLEFAMVVWKALTKEKRTANSRQPARIIVRPGPMHGRTLRRTVTMADIPYKPAPLMRQQSRLGLTVPAPLTRQKSRMQIVDDDTTSIVKQRRSKFSMRIR